MVVPRYPCSCRPGSTVNVVCRYTDHSICSRRQSDGRIMSTWWDVRTGWAGWFQVSGGVAAAGRHGTAIARYPFHLDLFTVGTDNRVYSAGGTSERAGSGGSRSATCNAGRIPR